MIWMRSPKATVTLSLLILAIAVTGLTWAQRSAQRKPNLLLVTFDTTRADRLGCYGFKDIKTPNVDRLAREGLLFTGIHAQAPQTLPNHSSIFTGLYTITHNVLSNGQRLDDKALTLAEILKANGYRTGAVVAAAPLMKAFNLHQGFDYYNDDFTDPALVGGFKAFLRFFSANKINLPTSKPAHRVAAQARQWLNRQSGRRKPFFLWVHFFDPHHPYEYRSDFAHPTVVTGDGELNAHGHKEKNYLNEIEFSDHYLGTVLDELDRLGLGDKTLTVFTTDHGESLGEHDYRGHRQDVYQNIIQVPLILRFPGRLPAGERLATPGMSIDITPTVLRLLQIPYLNNSFQGQNLLTTAASEPRKLFSVAVKLFTKAPIRKSLIFGDWKFIQFDQPERNALYNLKEDPEETNNLFRVGAELPGPLQWDQEIEQWWEQYNRLEFSDFKMTPEQLERLKSLGYIQP